MHACMSRFMDTPDLADSDRWVWCKCIAGELGLGFEEEGGAACIRR